jgi:hypothetical protein
MLLSIKGYEKEPLVTLEQVLGQTGHRTIFNIECDLAKDITQHSFYQSENEVLMYPAR